VINQAVVYNAKSEATEEAQKYVYADKDGEPTATYVQDSDALNTTNAYYAYYKLDDGTYVLENVATSAGTLATQSALSASNKIEKGKAATGIAGKYADNNTKLTVVNKNTTTNKYEVTTYTGINNFPATLGSASAEKVLVLYAENSNQATEIYVLGSDLSLTAAPAKNYAIYKGTGETDIATGAVEYKFLVNGDVVTVTSAKANATVDAYSADDNVVVDLQLNDDGTLKSANTVSALVNSAKVVAKTDSYVYTSAQANLGDGYQVVVTDPLNPEAELVVDATATIYGTTDPATGANVAQFIVITTAAPEKD
jgi:hypothetical protein